MTNLLLRAAIAPVVSALLITAGCYHQEHIPFDPRALQAPQREAAETQSSQPKRPLPTTLESPFLPGTTNNQNPYQMQATQPDAPPTTGPALTADPVIRMPLQEIMQRAVANNLDVRVAGFGPAIESTRVVEAEARFDPSVFVNSQFQRNRRAQATQFESIDNADIFTVQTGIRQNLPSGGQAELRYEANRTRVEPALIPQQFDPNPFYTSDLVLQVTQPILRDFGNYINRARILISRNNQRISLLDFRRQLEESAAEIEQIYWLLVQAERDVAISERLLDGTLRTAEVLWRRRGQDVTRVQLSQANASVEQRRAALIGAKARVRDLSDRLKRLMNDPEIPVTSSTLILPGSPPVQEPVRFDLDDLINTALSNRLELGQQQLRVESAGIAAKVARNNLLPQLNLIGSVSIQGLDDSYTSAFEDQMDFDNVGWAVGFQFEVPIGNRAARATNERARLQQQQAIVQYRNLIEQVALDVRTAMRDIDTRWDQIIATRQSRFAAEDALLAIQQREDAGEVLSPTFVQLKLDQQERFAAAASQENEAVSQYNNALATLERTKGTLLRYNNIVMEEDRVARR